MEVKNDFHDDMQTLCMSKNKQGPAQAGPRLRHLPVPAARGRPPRPDPKTRHLRWPPAHQQQPRATTPPGSRKRLPLRLPNSQTATARACRQRSGEGPTRQQVEKKSQSTYQQLDRVHAFNSRDKSRLVGKSKANISSSNHGGGHAGNLKQQRARHRPANARPSTATPHRSAHAESSPLRGPQGTRHRFAHTNTGQAHYVSLRNRIPVF